MADPLIGRGGAPTRATSFPEDAQGRKQHPVASGVLDYFPDALVAVARLSWQGNEQHNPGEPLYWNRAKSGDEADALMRHFMQRGTLDSDGIRHSAKVAWRALALLQKEIEAGISIPVPFPIVVEGIEPRQMCGARHEAGWVCTEDAGHDGRHYAGGSAEHVRW